MTRFTLQIIALLLIGCQHPQRDAHSNFGPDERSPASRGRNDDLQAVFHAMDMEQEARLQMVAESNENIDMNIVRQLLESTKSFSAEVEQELKSWSRSGIVQPPGKHLLTKMNVEGKWRVSRGYDGSSLDIRRVPSGDLAIRFASSGCMGGWQLDRTGRLTDGVLQLDGPVKEYFLRKYDQLFAVHVGKDEYLLPASNVDEFRKGLRNYGNSLEDITRRFYLFERVPSTE